MNTAAFNFLAATAAASASGASSLNDIVSRLKSPDEATSAAACETAHQYGASAVQPLAVLLADPDFELARKAKRALQRIVRHAGRPGANPEAGAVEKELLEALQRSPGEIRPALLWLLSEIGSERVVEPIAACLADVKLREDARCALLRLPGSRATAVLRHAFSAAPEEFKFALADALRIRGEKITGYPSRKLVPTAQTTVVAAVPKVK